MRIRGIFVATRYLLNEFIKFPLYFYLFQFERLTGLFRKDVRQDRDSTAIHQQTEHLEAGDDHGEQHVEIIREIVRVVYSQDDVQKLR